MSGIDRQQEFVESEGRRVYEKPAFSALALSVVTLGGSPGTGDSGTPPVNENPFGPNSEVTPNDEIDPDWGYDY